MKLKLLLISSVKGSTMKGMLDAFKKYNNVVNLLFDFHVFFCSGFYVGL